MDKDKKIKAITKAIAYAENNGNVNLDKPRAGKTGEMKSIYQFTPNTWKQYSKEVFGDSNVPLDKDTETYVVHKKVSKWYDEGKSKGKSDDQITREIASMWNAGASKPTAYKENWKGVNKKYGVAYDTPAYAEKVAKYATQFSNEVGSNVAQGAINNPALQSIMQTIKTASTKPQSNVAQTSQGLMQQLIPPQQPM